MAKLTPEEKYGLAAIVGMAACGIVGMLHDPKTETRELVEVAAAIGLLGWSLPEVVSMHTVAHELLGGRHAH